MRPPAPAPSPPGTLRHLPTADGRTKRRGPGAGGTCCGEGRLCAVSPGIDDHLAAGRRKAELLAVGQRGPACAGNTPEPHCRAALPTRRWTHRQSHAHSKVSRPVVRMTVVRILPHPGAILSATLFEQLIYNHIFRTTPPDVNPHTLHHSYVVGFPPLVHADRRTSNLRTPLHRVMYSAGES